MTTYEITRKTLEATPMLFGRRTFEKERMSEGLAEVLPAAFGHAMANGLAMVGPPFVRYVEHSNTHVTVDAGVPLAADAPPPAEDSALASGTLPGGPAAFTVHKGPYETLGDAHLALDKWMHDQDIIPTSPPWEVYITDPTEVSDPADWVTHLYQPI